MQEIPMNTASLYFGKSARLDAWLLHFLSENNLEYTIDPDKNASQEQMRFMLSLEENQVYLPCSDLLVPHLLSSKLDSDLTRRYHEKWVALVKLVRRYVPDKYTRKKIILLCRHKYRQIQASPIVIPSRMMKRFLTIFMTQSGIEDPFRGIRRRYNRQAQEAIESPELDRLLNVCPERYMSCKRLQDLRFDLDLMELERLIHLSTMSGIWTEAYYQAACDKITPTDLSAPESTRCLEETFGPCPGQPRKILYIPDRAGGLMFDILIIRSLLRQGHKVTLAVKEGFNFVSPSFWDWEHDPVLAKHISDAFFLQNSSVSKNELLSVQRQHPFLIISDGSREDLNLYRTSITFARAWKEADLIMATGHPQFRRLINTSQKFSRDVLCWWRDKSGRFQIRLKKRPKSIITFSEKDLGDKAFEIIEEMREARNSGQTVMFYSAIIGSLPGQVDLAIKVVDTYVRYLRKRLANTYIINPAEHFEEGMDADDLMYMWEKVQRSGLLNVWRFQTVADIERSFELMGMRVPPIWAGKDSTFSTGCTKEMQIALDVQRKHRELQIIGPAPEKFFRRSEYGVGKFSDAILEQ
ncbi:ARMT1-like domain-containing protein [Desulfobaculum bizertense]|uniref:Uncharacterized conserved protein, contains ATP-grasp and redox domains n=1 Tax=Desulfobaculum bizertense DSM 18034 TaxID=1121442 RepID=A0A1T4VJA2_9BACT|nr:ARMT1-like domain-containing protein [Desulfobaculum bizertense]SKA65029.1 Uncharacterized conserved protein, contains ATP-grasp and redox domains [Desulfobaculum bizertense DSM 18034]